jgi:hypothetical protein
LKKIENFTCYISLFVEKYTSRLTGFGPRATLCPLLP